MSHDPTPEQQAIIQHDLDRHATVLAVAGAGKTTTMVHRIRFLIDSGVPHEGIRAVMYNTSAKDDFIKKLSAAGLGNVRVQTFHSVGYGILTWAHSQGLIPLQRLITEMRELRDMAREAIREAAPSSDDAQRIDVDEALAAISIWKSLLTPPEDAQHLQNALYVDVYRAFERLRRRQNLITFDDQIYDAVRLLDRERAVRGALVNRLDHIIIDEFQDVNHARLRLAWILAGSRARVMVVGDDDQCIYEWQGARSSFIKRGFKAQFTHHPHATYKLTRSFRFGPAIAQTAANVIGHNTDRVEKDLVANDVLLGGDVTMDIGGAGGGGRQVIPTVQRLLNEGATPDQIVVLVRKYSQSFLVQSLFLDRKVPFFVEGERPLKEAYPIDLALRYLSVAAALDTPLTRPLANELAYIVQRPSRWVSRDSFARALQSAVHEGRTVSALLVSRFSLLEAGVVLKGTDGLQLLEQTLREAVQSGASPSSDGGPARLNGGAVLDALLDRLPFADLFSTFEGQGAVEDDIALMRSLALLLREGEIEAAAARSYVEALDTRQGQPDPQCVRMTSVFKAKGLEWDHVILPDLVEGQIPDLRATVNLCINKRDPGRSPDPTQALESERRLFYVAVTRARRTLHLFADPDDKRQLSRFVYEACVPPTREAIDALQGLLRQRGDPQAAVATIREGARSDARLREGLLKMLRRASQEPGLGEVPALEQAILSVNRIDPQPFSYPHAYCDAPAARRAGDVSDTGLPF